MCSKGAVHGCCISITCKDILKTGGAVKMYEICKGIIKDGTIIWTAVAWTDTRVYADMVFNALSIAHDGRFAILCNGDVIRSS